MLSIRIWPHDLGEKKYLKNRNNCFTSGGPTCLDLKEIHTLKTLPNLIVITVNPPNDNRIEFLWSFFLNIPQFSSDEFLVS